MQGEAHVPSPDRRASDQRADSTNAGILAHSAPKEVVFLSEEAFTFFSRPLVGRCSQPKGGKGAKATVSPYPSQEYPLDAQPKGGKGAKATGEALVTRRIAGCDEHREGSAQLLHKVGLLPLEA